MAKASYGLSARPNAYGFGHDWNLELSDGKTSKSYWLGQDAKVFSRILGMDYNSAPDYYAEKAGSRVWEKVQKLIAADVIRALLEMDADEPITLADVRKLMGAEPWAFHAGGG